MPRYLLAGGSVLDVGTGEIVRADVAVVDGLISDSNHSDLRRVD